MTPFVSSGRFAQGTICFSVARFSMIHAELEISRRCYQTSQGMEFNSPRLMGESIDGGVFS